jgi:hypothetical protein
MMIEFRLSAVMAAIALLGTTVILGLTSIGEPKVWDLLLVYLGGSLSAGAIILLLAYSVSLLIRFRQGGPAQRLQPLLVPVLKERATGPALVQIVSVLLFWAIILWAFNLFKQHTLPQAGFAWDPAFADLDHALFLGNDPWTITHAILAHPLATLAVDGLYHSWFAAMVVGILYCAVMRDHHSLRGQYMVAYGLTWLLGGGILAYVFGSAGPCFYDQPATHGHRFAPLMALLQEQHAWLVAEGWNGINALNIQAMLKQAFGASHSQLGLGISAMPSMHVAHSVLLALGIWRLSRRWGYFAFAFTFAIWVGSIHLGWHYAVDGILSCLIVPPIWLISGWLVRSFGVNAGSIPVVTALTAEAR